MGRIRNLQLEDKILSNIARGYKDMGFIAETLLPSVSVDTEVGRIRKFGKAFFRVYQTERALRAKTNRVPADDIDTIPYELAEHDIALAIDYREEKASTSTANSYNIKARYAQGTSRILQRGNEVAAAEILQNPATYPAGHSSILGAGDRFDEDTSDPIEILQDAAQTVTSKIGIPPNTLVLDRLSYTALKNHPGLIERIKYSSVGVMNIDLMQQLFDMPNIILADSVYADSDVSNFTYIWDRCAIFAYVAPPVGGQNDPEEPSFGYRLQLQPGIVSDEYQEEGGKITNVRSTDIYKHYVLGGEAGFLIQSTVA